LFVIVQKTADRPIITATRDDGVSVRIRSPDRKFTPPHDLIHFAVEKGLRLSGGFWGSIASGAKFDGMEVVRGRQKPKANELSARVIAANRTHLSRAEAFVGAFQTVLHEGITPPDRALQQRLQSIGAVLDGALVQSAWRDLLALRQQWLDLPQAQTIRLDWQIPNSN
jgi:hypothetical protein